MDELTFILILAGVGIVLLIAMYTYYKHHKKISDEINHFNRHADTIDDVLLSSSEDEATRSPSAEELSDEELPHSFHATRNDDFDVEQLNFSADSSGQSEPLLVQQSSTKTVEVASQEAANTETQSQNSSLGVDDEWVDGVRVKSRKIVNNSIEESTRDKTSSASSIPLEKPIAQPVVSKAQITKPLIQRNIKILYEPILEGVDELIISHTILSKGEFFLMPQLFAALEDAGLFHGEMNIFHYPGDKDKDTFALFSVANIIEPGTFDYYGKMSVKDQQTKTPGVSLFMRLPTRGNNLQAYEKFIQVARLIAQKLDAELCDETRSILTQQAIAHKKELIKKLNFDLAKAEKLANMKIK